MKIEIKKIRTQNNNTLVCDFEVSKELKKYFKEYEFFAEYNHDISDVPETILSIPLLTNLLPIAWFTGATIYIDSIDKEFYDSLETLKKAFQEVHPKARLGGGLIAKNIVENKKEKQSSSPAVMFSGGLDSVDSFLRHKEDKPYLVTVWGADIYLDMEHGWEITKNSNYEFAKKYGLENIFIKSNFRRFIIDRKLENEFKTISSWWGEVQHGLSLIGACAPVSFSLGFDKVYIPASHTLEFSVPWGSCPKIDNNIKWTGTKAIHDGYECSRQDKIVNLADYIKENNSDIQLRVCWDSIRGDNCGKCEKCCRTMTSLIAEGVDPKNHGFAEIDTNYIKRFFTNGYWNINGNILFMWQDIQKRLKIIGVKESSPHREFFEWILNADFIKLQKISNIRHFIRSIKYGIVYFFTRANR